MQGALRRCHIPDSLLFRETVGGIAYILRCLWILGVELLLKLLQIVLKRFQFSLKATLLICQIGGTLEIFRLQ